MTDPLHILHLEDDPNDRELVAARLAKEGLPCEFTYAQTKAEFLAGLECQPLDLIFGDYTLPGYSGIEALAAARKSRPEVPFIFLSGTIGEEAAVETFKLGAADYLRKDHLVRLSTVVARALEQAQLRRTQLEAEQRLHLIFEFAPDAYYLNDLEGNFVDGNRAAEKLIGYSRAELIGKSFLKLDLLPPEGLARAAALLARNAEGLATGPDEHTVRRKDGTLLTVEIRTYPVKLADQVLVLSIARDVTDRKLGEEELRLSEERFRSVWQHSTDGLRLTDHRGRILAVNDAYCRLVKVPRERLIGELFTATYSEYGNDHILADYCREFESNTVGPRHNARVKLWNSQELELEISRSFIEIGQGRKLLLSVLRDITETKRAERESAAFSQLGQRLSAANTAKQAAQIIVDVADQLLGWDACLVNLYSAKEDRVSVVLAVDLIDGRRTETQTIRDGESPAPQLRQAIREGGFLRLRGAPAVLPADSMPFGDVSRASASMLYVPIRKDTEVIGVLSIQSYTPNAYTEQSLATLQALSDHCAGALHRIRTQATLEETQRQLTHVLGESPAVIYSLRIIDSQPRAAWFSNYLQQLLGFSPEESLEPGWFQENLHCDDRHFASDTLPELLARKHHVRDYRFRHKRGGYLWIRDEQRLVCDSQGNPVEIVGSWVDITERKALEETQRRLAVAVEQAAESIVITDVSGNVLYVNPAFEKVSGYSRREVLGQNPRLLKSGKHDASFYNQMWSTLVRGQVWSGRLTNRCKNGDLLEEDVTITPIRDDAGRITNYVAVKHDVSRQVQLESQLRQAQKMEAIGQLAGGVAHDFNNLLVVMRGHAELLLLDSEQYSEPTRESLKQITAAAERSANLTRQLLAFSRKQVMQSQPLLLNDVILNVGKMLKRIIGENIDLQCHYGAHLPFIQADTGMLEQVLVNLVVNARDAMPHGGQLHVATESVVLREEHVQINHEARVGQFVCLKVRDTGVGIAAEHLPRIFEPFFTTKEVGKGTGLGLATVYGIAKQHKGWVEVASNVGAGTTFRLYLPAIPAPAPEAVATQQELPPRGGDETILLVEDDFAVCSITRRVLESVGYEVTEASCAREALQAWHARPGDFKLLLTDIVMPEGVTGRELAQQLRSEKPELKVIFLSGYSADVAGKDTSFFRRFDAQFLQKPCSSRVLLDTVRHSLDECESAKNGRAQG